jgi:hypothetical protein
VQLLLLLLLLCQLLHCGCCTATATTTVLRKQLRKLQSNKSGGLVGRVVSTHAPKSHRVVTPLDHTHRTRQPYVPRIGRPGVAAAGVITSSATTSLSLSRSLVAQARRPRAQPTRAEHARVGTEAQAGGRVNTVQWLRRNQNGKERHGIGERGNKHCVTSLLLAPSVSLSFYLSLSLSLLCPSLPQVADLNSVRCRAPQVVVLLCLWSSPRTVGRRAALPCAASGQDVGSITPSVVTPC